MRNYSIRFKTSVLYSSILCVILTAFSIYLFHSVRQILFDEVKDDLKVKAEQIEAFLNAYAAVSLNDRSPAALMNQFLSANGEIISERDIVNQLWLQDIRTLGLKKDFFRILGPQGRVLFRSENLTNEIEGIFNVRFPPKIDSIRFKDLQFNKIDYYGISYSFKFSNRNSFMLQLATPLTSVDHILFKLKFFIVGGIVFILLITLFIGSLLTKKILKPVTDVTIAADSISQKNLNMRIPEQKLDKEMQQLVTSFNRMIERLERSFTHVNEFSSHVAHELKTPLAVIKSEIDLSLGAGNTKVDDKRVMKVIRGEVDRLNKTINDMLFLAKIEYKLNIFKMEKIDFTEFLNDIYQDSKVLMAQKNINFTLVSLESPVFIQGDDVHLRRIFFNLIHNAVKFTPVQGEITILSEVREKQVFVSVKDTGIGIALEDQPRIFEKFYRKRRVGNEDAGGNGLGLSMARAVARSHGGDITFKSEVAKGSIFTVNLPILPN